MVEDRTQPRDRRVAGAARSREHRRHMVRVCGAGVIDLVTAIAILRQVSCVAAFVAGIARDGGVFSCEWKSGVVVVEGCRNPCRRGVANITGRGKSTGDMVRIRCAVEVCLVTRNAGGRQRRIHPALVTRNATQLRMRTSQRELCFAMVEICGDPSAGAVAYRAIRGKARFRMVGIGRGVEILHVARRAIRRRAGVLAANVAAQARHAGMHAAQGILRETCVIEVRISPGCRGVTDRAVRGPAIDHVIRIHDRLELLQVTAGTVRGQSGEVVTHMAAGALNTGVRACKGKFGFAVIESGARPVNG